MNKPRMVLNESTLMRQLFAIQDGQRMPNNELARLSGLSPDRISDMRRALYKKTPVEYAEALADGLGYDIVLRPQQTGPRR